MTKPLPIGIQTFAQIVEGGLLYVDKTQAILSQPPISQPKRIKQFGQQAPVTAPI